MQFLPDAFVKCGACDGRRFRPEVLEVRCRGPVDRRRARPARRPRWRASSATRRASCAALQPMLDLGLGYLSLSQPAPTLSGGEAQRLKLAQALAEAGDDEGPAVPARRADDRPARGRRGRAGRARCTGSSTPATPSSSSSTTWSWRGPPTGSSTSGPRPATRAAASWARARRRRSRGSTRRPDARWPRRSPRPAAGERRTSRRSGELDRGADARARGRRDAHPHRRRARAQPAATSSVEIPRDKLVAVTGVSGSGKSTLAFDVLFAEGQRRFLDCLSTYVRQFIRPLARPEVDRLEGVPPTVALEQKLSRGTPLSTVGTSTRGLPPPAPALVAPRHRPLPEVRPARARWSTRPPSPRAWPRTSPRGELTVLAPARPPAQGLPPRRDRRRRTRRASPRCGSTAPSTTRRGPPRVDRFQIHDVEAVVGRRRRAGAPARASRARAGDRAGRSRLSGGTLLALGAGRRALLLDAPLLPELRHRPARARPAPVLLEPEVRRLPRVRRLRRAAGRGGRRDAARAEGVACPRLRRHAPAARGPRGADRRPAHRRRSRRSPCVESRGWLATLEGAAARGGARARVAGADAAARPARPPRPRLPDARARGRHALDRRGAAHPHRGRPRLEPARRLLRARRADGGPAPARRRGAHAGAPAACATAATPWWWSSTRRASSARPTT